jgi:hypothetical protein
MGKIGPEWQVHHMHIKGTPRDSNTVLRRNTLNWVIREFTCISSQLNQTPPTSWFQGDTLDQSVCLRGSNPSRCFWLFLALRANDHKGILAVSSLTWQPKLLGVYWVCWILAATFSSRERWRQRNKGKSQLVRIWIYLVKIKVDKESLMTLKMHK